MNRKLIIRVLGALAAIEGMAMIPAFIASLIYRDGDTISLLIPILMLTIPGSLLWFLCKPRKTTLTAKEGFLIVGLGWVVLSICGAVPFVINGAIPLFTDALFEAVSGFTTTGATVVLDYEHFPRGLMLWRASTHWIGGMGVLVLTLALLPKLTGKTAHLVKAESPGPSLSKLVPKTGDTAKLLYVIYIALTLTEFICLLICGLTPYDALMHSLSNAGTGGFSNYSASIAAFNSAAVEIVITVFMVLFGINFAMYFKMLIGYWKDVIADEEFKWYLIIYFIAAIMFTFLIQPGYNDWGLSLRHSFFQTASIMSTTGFGLADLNAWPVTAHMLMIVIMFLGACAGSTAGGMKIIRVILLVKLGKREIGRTIRPRKVEVIRLNGKAVEESMLSAIAVFSFVYFALVVIGSFLISCTGQYGVLESFTASLTCVSNVGPGLGQVVSSFAGYSAFGKLVCSFLMLAGRLELFPMLILFHPSIWKVK